MAEERPVNKYISNEYYERALRLASAQMSTAIGGAGDGLGNADKRKRTIANIIREFDLGLSDEALRSVSNSIYADLFLLGPLESLLANKSVSEIMVNGPHDVRVEQEGRIRRTNITFLNDDHVMRVINRIVNDDGHHIDQATPMVDCSLRRPGTSFDGSRVNAVIPPVAVDCPLLDIRKFMSDKLSPEALIDNNTMCPEVARFLQAIVKARMNIEVSGSTGSGKQNTVSTKVFARGEGGKLEIRRLGDIKVGDYVASRDGKFTKVIGVYPQGRHHVWEVELKNGCVSECGPSHLWTVAKSSHGSIAESVVSTKDMYDVGTSYVNGNGRTVNRFWIPRAAAIDSAEVELPINPWVLGFLIGDGCLAQRSTVSFSTADAWVVNEMRLRLPYEIHKSAGNNYNYNIVPCGELQHSIQQLGLDVKSQYKFIPTAYKRGSLQQRLELLRGLMDSDGHCSHKGHPSYATVSERLAEDVRDLARTLGFSATISIDHRKDKYAVTHGIGYVVSFTGGTLNPFLLPRKANVWAENNDRKRVIRRAQTYRDCAEDKRHYLAGFFFTARLAHGVPHLQASHMNEELFERLISCLPDGSSFSSGNGSTFEVNCPSDGGIGRIFGDFGYYGVPVSERSIPDSMLDAEFLRGLADYAMVVKRGAGYFESSRHVRDEICRLLDAIGLTYFNSKSELCIPDYPDTLVHDSEKVRLCREWLSGRGKRLTRRDDYMPIVAIRRTDRVEDMVCIKVADDSHTFVLADGTVTHNTTLLNVLSTFIPNGQRIITVEDTPELTLQKSHVLRLSARQANIEGQGEVTIRQLVNNTLRMRPDRIIVGECRGGEAFDMLQAMSTGHDGSLTTIHANNPRASIDRLQMMVQMDEAGGRMPVPTIMKVITDAIDFIVQIKRYPDGSRHVSEIVEVQGMRGASGVPTLARVVHFEQNAELTAREGVVVGNFIGDGNHMTEEHIARFAQNGIGINPKWSVPGVWDEGIE